jgi:hypothetical protein
LLQLNSRCRLFFALAWSSACLCAPLLSAQACLPGELRAVVIDSQESFVFDADVRVSSKTGTLGDRSTATLGYAEFQRAPCGVWTVTVTKEGFETATREVTVTSSANFEIRLIVTPKMQTSSVDVVEAVSPVQQSASQQNQLQPAEVKTLPTNPATVNETLPLVPGIVRTPDGELKIGGNGQERSAMVVNFTDITDPATGKFGQSLPVDSIETVTVLTTPFLAQYGRFTQSVVAVETRRGGDKWHAALNDPFPDFRIRSYHLRGIRNETPRTSVGGPLLRNRLYFMSALQYFLEKAPSRTLPFPNNVSKQESINLFSQLDWAISTRQLLTATFHFSPQHTNFVNPDFFNPQPVSPSYAQHNYVGTIIHHLGLLNGILDSSISIQRYDVNVGAQGNGGMVLTPEGNSGNFFGTQVRSARRNEWLEAYSLTPLSLAGTHLVKIGSSNTWAGDDGRFGYRSVDLLDSAGRLEERIAFTNPPAYSRADLEVTAYGQDHWSLTPKLSVDYGARLEHQRLAQNLRVGPRGGVAWSPFENRRTVLRAGYGIFYDHLPLDIYTFSRYPQRTVTMFAPDGSLIGPPVSYENVIGSITGPRSFFVNHEQVAGAFSPRGATLNLQIEHNFASIVRLRAVYTDSRSVGLVALEKDTSGATERIVLNGDGKARYRQAEVTAKFAWHSGQQIVISYTRSRSEGNLNLYDGFLGSFPSPLVRPNIYTNLSADLPNRFLLWGNFESHVWNLKVLPIVEIRNGFPYARVDALQNYVGVPYSDATRFPAFFSADARVMRDFKVTPKYTLRLSVTAFNITNHFNALAVHANIADPQSGIFFGNYHRRYRGDFEIVF